MNNLRKRKENLKWKQKKIAMAQQENGFVRFYDENGSILFSLPGELVSYTSSTVSIKDGSFIRVYDANGSHKFSR